MNYFGGKGGPGVFHTILRNVPPHRVYIEPFAGGANVFDRKARAQQTVLIERCPIQAAALRSTIVGNDVEILNADCMEALQCVPWTGDEFLYVDPPYVRSTRTSSARYNHEYDDADHARLLTWLASLQVPFALSGYRSAMYDEASSSNGWRRIDFPAMTRGGPRTESLWCNYPAPAAIADPVYAGQDFRDRQRIKRKAARWVDRFTALPSLERQAILAQLEAAGIVGPVDARSCSVNGGAAAARSTTSSALTMVDRLPGSIVGNDVGIPSSQLTLLEVAA